MVTEEALTNKLLTETVHAHFGTGTPFKIVLRDYPAHYFWLA
jgi:hypothetical protein